MTDPSRTNQDLHDDISALKLRIRELEQSETDRKRAEDALRDSEERYQQLLDNTNTGFVVIDDKGIVIMANESYRRIAGAKGDADIIGHSFIEWTAPDEHENNTKAVALCAIQGFIKDFETIYQHGDGQRVHILINATAYQLPEGGKQIISFCRDITDRKIAERKIREADERYRALYERSFDAIYIHDAEGNFLEANDTALDMLGYSREDLPINFVSLLSDDQLPRALDALSELSQKGFMDAPYEFKLTHKNSKDIWIEVRGVTVCHDEIPLLSIGIARDITRRKQAEEVLRESELFLKESHRIARLGGWKANPYTDYLEWSEGVYNIIGEPLDYKPGLSEGMKYFLPQYILAIKNSVADCLINGKPFSMECEATTATGQNLWTEVRGIAPIVAGERSYVIGTFQDITDRKQAEEKYRLLVENANDAIFITQDGAIKFPNRKTIETLEYTEEELASKPLTQYIHPEDRDMLVERQKKRSLGESIPLIYSFRAINRSGRELWLEISEVHVDWEGKPANLNFMRDVTDQRKLETGWKKTEFITNSAQELMTLVNRHYIYEAANNAYCSAHRKSRDEVIGKTMAEIWGEHKFHKFIKPMVDRCFEAETISDEDWVDFPYLGRRYFTITYYPYYQIEGKVTHASVITHDITERKLAEEALKRQDQDLQLRAKELEEANTALRVFFKQQSEEQKKMEEALQLNVNQQVLPYIKKLQQQNMGKQSMTYLELLEANLNNIVSPFMRNLSAAYQNLTPQEIQIAGMIKQGESSQEMAMILNLSVSTVNTHRNNIRKKLNLRNQGTNLRSYLLSLS